MTGSSKISRLDFLHSDQGHNTAFVLALLACFAIWLTAVLSGYTKDFLFLDTDTMVLYQHFKHLYDSFYTFKQFPLWNPHFLYGASDSYWYFQHSPLEYAAIIIGKLFNHTNSYKIFNIVLALEQCVFSLGVALLLWRFKAGWFGVFLLLPIVLLAPSYETSVWHIHRSVYLMPLMMYFLLDLAQFGRVQGLLGALITWAASLFGNIGYEVIFIFYASLVFFIALVLINESVVGRVRTMIDMIRRPDWRIIAALGLSLLVTFLYFYTLAADRLGGHTDIFRAGRDPVSLKIPLDQFMYDNSTPAHQFITHLVTIFSLNPNGRGQLYIGMIATFFLVYLLANRPTKLAKVFLILVIFGELFTASQWFLLKYPLYWVPGAAYFHGWTPIAMLAKQGIIVLAALGTMKFMKDIQSAEGPLKLQQMAISFLAWILLILAFHESMVTLSTAAVGTEFREVRAAYILISLAIVLTLGWTTQRYAPALRRHPRLIIAGGFALVAINFGIQLNTFDAHRNYLSGYRTYIKDGKKSPLSAKMIAENYKVRPFTLPTFRTMDMYDPGNKLPGGRTTNSAWLSATGVFPCIYRVSTISMSKAVANFFRNWNALTYGYKDEYFMLYTAEGTGPVPNDLDKDAVAKKYLACSLPIARLSDSPVLVDSPDGADAVLSSVLRRERDFVDVIVAGKAAGAETLPDPARKPGVESVVETALYSPNKVVFNVRASRPSWLIFTDGYDRRWSAAVDGARTEIHLANRGFKAVRVPAGDHAVAFEFRSPVTTGMIWALVGLLPACLILCVWLALRDLWVRPAPRAFPS